MKTLYDDRETNQHVTIKAGSGGSPKDVIDCAIQVREAEFDKKYVLIDSDVKVEQKDFDKARVHKVVIIQASPICLEGMLLEVLGCKAGKTNKACKAALKPHLTGTSTSKTSYAKAFPKAVLDKTTKPQIVSLRKIISNS
ncbi:hypothetical protein [Shewanella kaireitica]|uniref:hypothetical protein n=1 Tax=Shewanella kaireitica TaxID=212021 RepID=UPI00200DA443|nr:hypothetical protein [Shewanella kaireitica]MCL1095983.1 hypothetical protein [Shewanella kaireitica]